MFYKATLPVSEILVLCIGNICRSPLAQAALQSRLGPAIRVSSAGLNALRGHPAHEMSQCLARENDLDISDHQAQPLTPTLLYNADLILVMTQHQKSHVLQAYTQTRGRVFLLHQEPETDIPDPYQKDEIAFRDAWMLILSGVEYWGHRLCPSSIS